MDIREILLGIDSRLKKLNELLEMIWNQNEGVVESMQEQEEDIPAGLKKYLDARDAQAGLEERGKGIN